MTGSEHYREAMRLLTDADTSSTGNEFRLAAAQVHATLALILSTHPDWIRLANYVGHWGGGAR